MVSGGGVFGCGEASGTEGIEEEGVASVRGPSFVAAGDKGTRDSLLSQWFCQSQVKWHVRWWTLCCLMGKNGFLSVFSVSGFFSVQFPLVGSWWSL